MMTWLQAWPLLGLPVFFSSLIGAIPTLTLQGRVLGGGPFRQWMLNHFLVPLLPATPLSELHGWFLQAGVWEQWCLVTLVALNLNALLLPVLYWLVGRLIALNTWMASKSYELKSNAVRR